MVQFRKVGVQKTLEIIANIALIVCCIIFAVVLVSHYFGKRNQPKTEQSTSLIGKKLSLENVDWSHQQKNLVLVLSKTCRYCDESAPFYQRLVKETTKTPNTRLISVFPQPETEDRQYLKDKMVDIAEVRQVSLRAIGVRGTPALLLVDNTGNVVEEWLGKLPADVEEIVIARLKR